MKLSYHYISNADSSIKSGRQSIQTSTKRCKSNSATSKRKLFQRAQSQRKSGNVLEKVDSLLQLGTITTDFITLDCVTSAHIKATSCSQNDGELYGGGPESMCNIWVAPGERDRQLTRYNPMTSKEEHIPLVMPNQEVELPMPALSVQHLHWWNKGCQAQSIRY